VSQYALASLLSVLVLCSCDLGPELVPVHGLDQARLVRIEDGDFYFDSKYQISCKMTVVATARGDCAARCAPVLAAEGGFCTRRGHVLLGLPGATTIATWTLDESKTTTCPTVRRIMVVTSPPDLVPWQCDDAFQIPIKGRTVYWPLPDEYDLATATTLAGDMP
jgi:hypothetical protein